MSIVNGIPVYLAGNHPIFPSKSMDMADCIEFKASDFTFDYDDTISSRDSYDGMKELMGLSPEIGRLLVAHTVSGILRNAFKVNSFKPENVLVIVGKSGMFKTQYVSHMVQLYNRNSDIKPSTRFNSSKSFIENDLYKYCDCTAVIDDLHTGESISIRRNNEITAEEIIRRISDDTGRGIKDGKSLVQRSFNGNVVFVGEYMIGKGSTVPRELIANITRQIDGRILYKYQNSKKLIVSTFYRYFIQWYVNNYTELCNFIGRKLNEHRQREPIYGLHARLNDTAFYLITSYQIFLKFCFGAGFVSEQEVLNDLGSFHRQVNELVVEQQKRYRLNIDNTDLLAVIGRAYKKRLFRIADCVENFDENKHDGVIHYDCLCFYSKRFDSVMSKLIPNFNHDDVIRCLKNNNALKLHEPEGKNGVKIYMLRKRFYAIYLDKLK